MPGFLDFALAAAQALLLPVLAGCAFPRELGGPTRAFLGAASIGAVVVAGHGLGVPQPVAMGAAATFALGAAALALRRRDPATDPPLSGRERLALAALWLALLPLAAAAVLRALHDPVLAWDARKLWYGRVRDLYFWEPIGGNPLSAYPELGPALWMLPVRWLGLAYEGAGRAVLPIAYFAWIAALPRLLGRPIGFAAAAAAALSAPLAFDVRALTDGYQDALVLVASGFACVALLRLVLGAGEPSPRHLAATGVLTGLPALVKQEGLVWGLVLAVACAAALLAGRRRPPWRQVRRLALPFAAGWIATVASWPALLAWNHVAVGVQGDAFTVASIAGALGQVDRWPVIAPYFARYAEAHRFHLLACAVSAGAAAAMVPRLRRALAMLATVLLLHMAFLALAFLSTRSHLAWHLENAFARLAYQGDFVYVVVVSLALGALGLEIEARRPPATAPWEPDPGRALAATAAAEGPEPPPPARHGD